MRERWEGGSPGAYVNNRVSHGNFCLFPVLYRTALPCSSGYHLEIGGMPLHYTVGVNCKKGATTERKSMHNCPVHGLSGVCWMVGCA